MDAMAAHGWGKSPSVEEWLFDEGHTFDFFQAVALLSALRPDAAPVGEGTEPSREPVRFSSSIGLGFPETDIARVQRPEREDAPASMVVHFLGLAGALGPLPTPFVELVYRRTLRGDHSARAFLDIFNHRLVSLAYRIRKHNRIGLGSGSPERDDAARHLFALFGMGLSALQGRMGVPDRALLHHAGTLSHEHRSMEGLAAILRHHFGLPVEMLPLTGAFHFLEPSDRTAIGPGGGNRELGRSASLGVRFWDQEAAFEVRLGPLSFADFKRFLPGGDALLPLLSLIRFYGGQRFDFGVRLVLREGEAPPLTIGKGTLGLLGYSAFLGGSRGARGDREVRIVGAAIKRVLEGKAAQAPAAARS
jgi:type VI secretion system protein ImpH